MLPGLGRKLVGLKIPWPCLEQALPDELKARRGERPPQSWGLLAYLREQIAFKCSLEHLFHGKLLLC